MASDYCNEYLRATQAEVSAHANNKSWIFDLCAQELSVLSMRQKMDIVTYHIYSIKAERMHD